MAKKSMKIAILPLTFMYLHDTLSKELFVPLLKVANAKVKILMSAKGGVGGRQLFQRCNFAVSSYNGTAYSSCYACPTMTE
jgi:hypothetical protein